VEHGKCSTVPAMVKKLGVSEQTYYRWRKEYGGIRTDQARRLKVLECERRSKTAAGGGAVEKCGTP